MGVAGMAYYVKFVSGLVTNLVMARRFDNVIIEVSSTFFGLLQKFAVRICNEVAENQENAQTLTDATEAAAAEIQKEIMKLIELIRSVGFNGNVYIVTDGISPATKAEVAAERKYQREKAFQKFLTLRQAGGIKDKRRKMRKAARSAVSFASIRYSLARVLAGFDDEKVIVCEEPLEADFKVAQLMLQLPNSLVISSDGDFLLRPSSPGAVHFRFGKKFWALNGSRKWVGEYYQHNDVASAFGLDSASPLTPAQITYLQRCMVAIFCGGRTDYQRSRPKGFYWSEWNSLIVDAWKDGRFADCDCYQLIDHLIATAATQTGKPLDYFADFRAGCYNSLAAVLDGVFSGKGLGELNCQYYKTSFGRERLLPANDFSLEYERVAAGNAIDAAFVRQAEARAVRSFQAAKELEEQRERSRQANAENKNAYPRVVAVDCDVGRCKALKFQANADDEEEHRAEAEREMFAFAEKLIHFTKVTGSRAQVYLWNRSRTKAGFNKLVEKVQCLDETPLSEASPNLSCGRRLVETLCDWPPFGFQPGEIEDEEVEKKMEEIIKAQEKRKMDVLTEKQRQFVAFHMTLDIKGKFDVNSVALILKCEQNIQSIATKLGYKADWKSEIEEIRAIENVLENEGVDVKGNIARNKKPESAVQLLRQLAAQQRRTKMQWIAEYRKLLWQRKQDVGKGNTGVITNQHRKALKTAEKRNNNAAKKQSNQPAKKKSFNDFVIDKILYKADPKFADMSHKTAEESFAVKTINANLFSSLIGSEFVQGSNCTEKNKEQVTRAIIFVFHAIQSDLSLRAIAVSKLLQQKLLVNHQLISCDKLFGGSQILTEEESVARQELGIVFECILGDEQNLRKQLNAAVDGARFKENFTKFVERAARDLKTALENSVFYAFVNRQRQHITKALSKILPANEQIRIAALVDVATYYVNNFTGIEPLDMASRRFRAGTELEKLRTLNVHHLFVEMLKSEATRRVEYMGVANPIADVLRDPRAADELQRRLILYSAAMSYDSEIPLLACRSFGTTGMSWSLTMLFVVLGRFEHFFGTAKKFRNYCDNQIDNALQRFERGLGTMSLKTNLASIGKKSSYHANKTLENYLDEGARFVTERFKELKFPAEAIQPEFICPALQIRPGDPVRRHGELLAMLISPISSCIIGKQSKVEEKQRKCYRRQLAAEKYILTGSVNIDSTNVHFGVFDTRNQPPKKKKFYTPRRTLHQQLNLPDLDKPESIEQIKKNLGGEIDIVIGTDLGTACASAQFAALNSAFDPGPKRRANDEAEDDRSRKGVQMIFRQREIDAPLRTYRNWLMGRKERCEININQVEAASEATQYDQMVAIVLQAFYSDPTVKRRKTDCDRKRLAIMDRRADKDVDDVAKYYGLLSEDRQARILVSLGRVDDRSWRKASHCESKSYATYAKVRIRHAKNRGREVRITEVGEDGLERSIRVPAPRVEFIAQSEDGTTGICLCGNEMEHPHGIIRLYYCPGCPQIYHRDGISSTLMCYNGMAAAHGDPRRTYKLQSTNRQLEDGEVDEEDEEDEAGGRQ